MALSTTCCHARLKALTCVTRETRLHGGAGRSWLPTSKSSPTLVGAFLPTTIPAGSAHVGKLCLHGAWSRPQGASRRRAVLATATLPSTGAGAAHAPKYDEIAVETVRDELARRELKSQLWQAAAGLDRGMAASSAQREQVEALVLQLEAINPTPAPCQSAVPSIDGTWHLLYSSVQEWRSSPFFWALQGVLDEILGEEEAAQPLYSFLNSMRQPLQVTLGPRIAQHVDAARGLLVSEMDVALLTALADGIRLRLTTTSTLAVTGPATAEVTVRTTQLRDCNVAPLLDRLPIPVEPLLTLLGSWGSLRGSTSRKHTGAATITMYTPYLDEDLRIIRTPDGEVFVYHRDLAPASEGPSSIERLVG
eukprot:jgi/Mesvir1/5416/Mv15480-RA.1